MKRRRAFGVAWLVVLPVQLMGNGLRPEDVIQKVEQELKAAKSIQVQFEEIYEWKQTGDKQTVRGEMLLQGEDQFRVATDDQTIVSDGTTLWTYSKPSNRVLIDRLEKTDNAVLPRQMFFGYKKDYQVRLGREETLNGSPCYVLLFTAEKKDVYIVQIRVWVDKERWIPRKIEQVDLSKNHPTFLLHSVETGAPVDVGTFQFVVPEGAEIIRL